MDADYDVRCTWAGTQVFPNFAASSFVALATNRSCQHSITVRDEILRLLAHCGLLDERPFASIYCAIDLSVANMFLIPLGTDSNR